MRRLIQLNKGSNTYFFKDQELSDAIKDYWKVIYPVGACYFSTENTSPATLFGGTWSALSNYIKIGTSYTTGGASTVSNVSLTANQLPAHSHSFTTNSNNFSHRHSFIDGGHEHSTNEVGNHTHNASNNGQHAHTSTASPNHTHPTLAAAGEHTHVINADKSEGQHNHTIQYRAFQPREYNLSTQVNNYSLLNPGLLRTDGYASYAGKILVIAPVSWTGATKTWTNSGVHSHSSSTSSGDHNHYLTNSGTAHTHSGYNAGGHTHEAIINENHTHTMSQIDNHTHTVNSGGNHTHSHSTSSSTGSGSSHNHSINPVYVQVYGWRRTA